MLTKDDLMKLSKERLCELLLEEWNKDTSVSKEIIVPFSQPDWKDCFHGGQCTNPFHDCVNCPRVFSGNDTTISTDGTNLQPSNK